MNKNFLKLILLSSAIALTGCRSLVTAEVYSADVFSNENIRTPATMKMEISSCNSEKRSEYEQKALALFDLASKAKITDCVRESMDSFLEVSFEAELATETSQADLILFRHAWEDDDVTAQGIKPIFSSNFIQRVDTMLQESFQKFEYDDLTFSIAVHNDLREDILISVTNAWVDGTPHQSYRRQPLERRGKVVVKLPNVTSDLILQNQYPIVVWVAQKK